jgi:hypothetical protein
MMSENEVSTFGRKVEHLSSKFEKKSIPCYMVCTCINAFFLRVYHVVDGTVCGIILFGQSTWAWMPDLLSDLTSCLLC